MGIVFVYITNPNEKEAYEVARYLLEKKLIACANIFPVKSIYWWKGKIANEKESVLIAKTFDRNFDKVKTEVEKIHPYETPCIAKISVKVNEKFANWLSALK